MSPMHMRQDRQQAARIASDIVVHILECASVLRIDNMIFISTAGKKSRSTISGRYSLTDWLDIWHEVEMSKWLLYRDEKRSNQGPAYNHYVKKWTAPVLLKVLSALQEGDTHSICREG